jgi:hypothetical protein
MQKGLQLLTTLKEDDLLDMKVTKFMSYCGLADYLAEGAASCSPVMAEAGSTMEANENEVNNTMALLMVQDFQRGVNCDKNHYV